MARVDKKTGGRGRQNAGSLEELLAEAKEFMEVGKYGKAASTLKKLLGNHPDHWEALRLSATLNLKLGSLFAARSSFESLARTAFEREDHLLAQSLLKEYLAVVPRYIPFLELLGRAMEGSGNLNGALVEYGKALSFIQETEDAEQEQRGPQIYLRVKALDPYGPITKRLAEIYEPLIASNGEATAQSTATPDSASSGSSGWGGSTGEAERVWESQGEPAPFPWEVPPGSSDDSPASVETDQQTDSSLTLPPSSESPSGSFTLTADTTPATPAAEPEVTADPFVPDPVSHDAPADAPALSSPSDEEPSVAESAPVEDSWSAAAASPVVEEEPAPPVVDEPEPKPASKGFFGFRFATGFARSADETEQEAPPEPSRSEETVEAEAPSFIQPPDDVVPEPDATVSFTPEPEPEPEPDASRPEPTGRTRRARKRGADKDMPTAPTWAAPSAAGDSGSVAPVRLFPTAGKLRFKTAVFARRVFSAVRSLTLLTFSLVMGIGVLALLAVAGLSLLWVGMEEKPSNSFYNLMRVPTPPLLDRRQNGYLKLLAIGVSPSWKPIQMSEGRMVASGDPSQWPEGFADLAAALSGWYGEWDPAQEFRKQRTVIRQWSAFFGALMAKYHGWVGSRIEDVGYGTLEAPDEALILGIHRLYVAEGFSGGIDRGLERLQRDAETWRKALEEARTLRFKLLAVEALNDDLIVMSGLLSRANLDPSLLPTMARMSRPLDHSARSLRWPMQSQFGLELEMTKRYLRSGGDADPRPTHIKAVTFLPLPKQKVFNAHAAYYEALAKHDSLIKVEGDPRKNMPLRYKHTNAPSKTLSDYIVNPIDNLLVKEDRVDWHDVIGRIVETEARLRLGTLQVRIRRAPATSSPLARVADAGQQYYDPFTGFTMLMDGSKTILYSVGRNGQDNDGDRTFDVSVPLFPQPR